VKTLYLIRGVSGAGKSTFARSLQESGVVDWVFEADNYFVDRLTGQYHFDPKSLQAAHTECQRQTIDWLSNGFNVAVSNTSTTEAEVETYRKIAEDCNARFVSLVVESRHDGKNIHGVPPEKVEQMRKRFSVKV
jgi:predicted kinase